MDVVKVLYSREEIAERVRELADIISRDYQGKELMLVCVLKGAFVFMADLIRYISIPCIVDFIRVSSYGSGKVSSGEIIIKKDIETPVKGKDILIIEDIIDTGLTLSLLSARLKERKPDSLKVCAFLDKRYRREVEFEADYVGFTLTEEGFVVGYGIDFNEKWRSLPDVCVIEEQ
jgi:hypoxanthine phosphoribosyltransferase (EC 2.4.2.8)